MVMTVATTMVTQVARVDTMVPLAVAMPTPLLTGAVLLKSRLFPLSEESLVEEVVVLRGLGEVISTMTDVRVEAVALAPSKTVPGRLSSRHSPTPSRHRRPEAEARASCPSLRACLPGLA